MITKWVNHLYQLECGMFLSLNSHFDRQQLNVFFRYITNLGGASGTVGLTLLIILISDMPVRMWGIESAVSLASSHIFVSFIKKVYPRSRPYLSVSQARVTENPLKDHSFPSGHTTAIFSLITPYVIHMSILGFFLYPLALCVGVSRVFLGLHYPSDVLAGSIVGTAFGIIIVFLI
jgi:undecaprenyl-diphosphatase